MENKEKFSQMIEILAKLDPIEFAKLFDEKQSKKSATQSEEIKELVSALSKAQGSMKPAVFNRINPHYKNRYADFTSCMDSCREPLSNNGLSIMQYCETVNDKLMLVTMLAHTSGQWMKSYFPLNPVKMDSQSIGSAMTYGKRYSLSAMLGIVSDDEDDDGEASHGRGTNQQTVPKPINGQGQARFAENLKSVQNDMQKAVNLPAPKINPLQVETLKKLEEKLDAECKSKLYAWLNNQYKVSALEEISVDIFQKVLGSFENAVKFIEQQKLEVAHA